MKKFSSNKDVTNSIKAIAADNGTALQEIAARLGISPQNLSGVLSKQGFSFRDAARIADALGYDLYFDFQRRPGK